MKFILLFIALVFSQVSLAGVEVAPYVGTTFPVFVGGGLSLISQEKYEVSLGYGFTPEAYYRVIGKVAANLGDNSSYSDVIEAGFQDNSVVRFNFQYNFDNFKSGWFVGGGISYLDSSGKAGIDTVLAAATGRDYTTLKNLLTLAGRDTQVDMQSDLYIAEVYCGKKYELDENFLLSLSVGIAKVIASDVNLQTGLPVFEASANGSALMRSTESDLEDILSKYGISPTFTANLSYLF